MARLKIARKSWRVSGSTICECVPLKFVVYDQTHEAMYLRFASKVGGFSRGMSFGYYGNSDGIVVRRHILIDDAADPPIVVGAVTTKEQDYVIGNETASVAVATYPISLGIAEPRYAMAGMLIFRKLLEVCPLSFLLGMGPPETNTTAGMCQTLGWQLSPVPYLFLPRRFAQLAAKQLAHRPLLASATRMAGHLGLFAPAEAIQRAIAQHPTGNISIEQVAAFDAELDAWWMDYSKEIGFGLVRDSRQLNAMFPVNLDTFERLVFRRDGQISGVAILLIPKPEDARKAMGANVITLVDFCVHQTDLADAAATLSQWLFRQRVDAVIVNNTHTPTVESLKSAGFRPRTTNMYLAASPALSKLLQAADVGLAQMVISRADGDGPIGLGVEL